MKLSVTLLAMSFLAFTGLVQSSALEIGQDAPQVTSIDETGEAVRLGDFYQNGLTLVYFYPKAGTPGCTVQACSLRDSFEGLKVRGVRIVGVSADKAEAQKTFHDKYQLPFTLLADADGKVA